MAVFVRIVYALALVALIYIAPWWIVLLFFIAGLLSIRWYFELLVLVTLYLVIQTPMYDTVLMWSLLGVTLGIVAAEYIRVRYFNIR